MNIENAQLHDSGLVIEYIITFKIGHGGFRIPSGRSYIDLQLWIKNKKGVYIFKMMRTDVLCMLFNVEYMKYNPHPERKSHYNNDR